MTCSGLSWFGAPLPSTGKEHQKNNMHLIKATLQLELLLMDKILHYPLYGIYHNSHSLESLRSCRILSINRVTLGANPSCA